MYLMTQWTLSRAKKANHVLKYAITLMTLFSVILASQTEASYSRLVPWTEMQEVKSQTIVRSQYNSMKNLYDPSAISDATVEAVLKDPDKKIGKDFHVPAELKPSVTFWMKIYTRFSTKQVVLFDGKHLDVIYDVIDLRKYAETAKNPIIYELLTTKAIKRSLDSYRKAFATLAAHPHAIGRTREEKNILNSIKVLKHRHSFKELAEQLKAIRGQRDSVVQGLAEAETFIPKMEQIFKRMGVPPELTRISLVESSFNMRAYSKVGARGIWQFMPALGKKYLLMDEKIQVDERLSPLKSTLAAGKLLTWNYQHLGNWVLAIIAYNHGLKNLPKLRGQKSSFQKIAHVFDSCVPKPALGWASRNYYSEFLAVLYAETYRTTFYGKLPTPTLRSVTFYPLKEKLNGLSFALKHGISLQEFRLFNADVQDLHKPLPKGFWVAIPGDIDNIGSLVEHRLAKTKSKKHS